MKFAESSSACGSSAPTHNAILLAHHYQRPEVQEVADAVADSLKLSQAAAKTNADVIVFCGVHFMAETAAILCPEKTVLLPDLRAGCSLAASVTVEELRKWKAKLPDAVVVAYINTSAAVKAESDYCCTSANAAKVVSAIPADRPILFLPDKFLAAVVARQTGRSNIVAYPGYCHVHKTIRPDDVVEILDEHPDIELLLHPECGCVSSCMAKAADGTLPQDRTFFLSTEGMLRHIGRIARERVCRGNRTRHHASARTRNIPEKKFYPGESERRLRLYENDHARPCAAIARNHVAAGHRAGGNRPEGPPRHRSHAGARVNGPGLLRIGIFGVGSIGQTLATALDAKTHRCGSGRDIRSGQRQSRSLRGPADGRGRASFRSMN